MRVTVKHLAAKVAIVNEMLGYGESPSYPTIGAFHLYQAYGGYDVHRICNDGGGVESLTGGCGPARECGEFLSGMIATLRLVGADARSSEAPAGKIAKQARDQYAARWSR